MRRVMLEEMSRSPEKNAPYMRAYYAKNREKMRTYKREYMRRWRAKKISS